MTKLFHDYILIELEEVKNNSILERTDLEDKKTEIAKVLEISPDLDGDGLKAGDRIVFKSYAIDEVVDNEDSLTFIKFEDVIGIL